MNKSFFLDRAVYDKIYVTEHSGVGDVILIDVFNTVTKFKITGNLLTKFYPAFRYNLKENNFNYQEGNSIDDVIFEELRAIYLRDKARTGEVYFKSSDDNIMGFKVTKELYHLLLFVLEVQPTVIESHGKEPYVIESHEKKKQR